MKSDKNSAKIKKMPKILHNCLLTCHTRQKTNSFFKTLLILKTNTKKQSGIFIT